jgi:Transposase domain (DUF772)
MGEPTRQGGVWGTAIPPTRGAPATHRARIPNENGTRDLLKLYLYGYLQQSRSSRRLESECRRNIELMWLLGRLAPDHKTIAEFRRMHREGVTAAGADASYRWVRGCAGTARVPFA